MIEGENMMEVLSKIIVPFITAFITAFITLYIARRITLSDNLDSKSGWRKELFEVASKANPTMDDVYRIRAALRYYPKYREKQRLGRNDIRPYEFAFMSDLFSEMCDDKDFFKDLCKSNKCYCNNGCCCKRTKDKLLNDKGAKLIRIMARYLLKIHWESRRRLIISRADVDQMDAKLPNDEIIGLQTIKLIDEVLDNDIGGKLGVIINKMSSTKCTKVENQNELTSELLSKSESKSQSNSEKASESESLTDNKLDYRQLEEAIYNDYGKYKKETKLYDQVTKWLFPMLLWGAVALGNLVLLSKIQPKGWICLGMYIVVAILVLSFPVVWVCNYIKNCWIAHKKKKDCTK